MTTAEKYRQLEKSPVINIARYIFNDLKSEATNTTLEKVISDIKTGKTPSKQEKRFYEDDYLDWFKPNEIGSEKYLYNALDKVSKYAFETKQATIYEPDTILINAIGDVGRISILKIQASSNQQITGIRLIDDIFVDYAYFYLLAHREYFYVDLFQTTLPIVNQKKINAIPFCYPKIEEQKSIVKGLEEIENIKSINDFHIIDNLDWKEEYKDICRNFFNLQFGTKEISSELTYQLNLIKLLRLAFLRDAMQGKLVKTTNTKETGKQLLEKIKGEKIQLIAEKKLKKEKELSPITEEEIPFKIPQHWTWCRLGEIAKYVTSGSREWSKFYSTDGAYFIRSGEIKTNRLIIEDAVKVNLPLKIEGKRSLVERGDLLTTITGANVGKCALIDYEIPEAYVSQSVALTKLVDTRISKFIHYCFQSPIGTGEDLQSSVYGIGRPVLSLPQIQNLKVPLPPIHEQDQIVAKLDELMDFCYNLEESIKINQGYNEKLLQQVSRETLGLKLTERNQEKIGEKDGQYTKRIIKKFYTDGNDTFTTLSMKIVEILKTASNPLPANVVWNSSEYSDDIELFYTELKKLIDVQKVVVEEKIGMESYLKLATNEN